jgi:hypothetical protein
MLFTQLKSGAPAVVLLPVVLANSATGETPVVPKKESRFLPFDFAQGRIDNVTRLLLKGIRRCAQDDKSKTKGPSTPLRFARDDTINLLGRRRNSVTPLQKRAGRTVSGPYKGKYGLPLVGDVAGLRLYSSESERP